MFIDMNKHGLLPRPIQKLSAEMSVSEELRLAVGNCAGAQSVQDAINLLRGTVDLIDMLRDPDEDARWLVEGVKPHTTPPIPFAMAYLMAVNGRFDAADAVLAELARALTAAHGAMIDVLFQCTRERLRACAISDIRVACWLTRSTWDSVARMRMF